MKIYFMDNIHSFMVGNWEDYVNQTMEGSIIWSIHLFDSDSKEAWDDWKNGKHNLSSIHYTMIQSIWWIVVEFKDTLACDGMNVLDKFL